jgi:citrate lyase synthetase
MRGCRTQLVTGLITAINAKATGLTVYTKVPKSVVYPYLYLTEIIDIENGSKNQFMYDYDMSLELVYKDLTDKTAMWTAVDLIKQIITNREPFSITGGFNIMAMTLVDTTEAEDLLNSQEVDTTTIRVNFDIQDNN